MGIFGQCLVDIVMEVVGKPLTERVLQTFLNGILPPCLDAPGRAERCLAAIACLLGCFLLGNLTGKFDKTLLWRLGLTLRMTVENYVLDDF